MKKYIIEQFTSRNTSHSRIIEVKTLKEAIKKARGASTILYFPVILKSEDGAWEKYENGVKTEWSEKLIK